MSREEELLRKAASRCATVASIWGTTDDINFFREVMRHIESLDKQKTKKI